MPQLIYGSSPDALAGQQNWYDNYYLGANQGNRAAYMQAQQRTVDLQQQRDAEAARRADEDAQRRAAAGDAAANRDYQSGQNALDRDAQTKNLIIGKSLDEYGKQDAIFKEAAGLAGQGLLPPSALETYRGVLSPDRFTRLTAIAGAIKQQVDTATAQTNQPIIAAHDQGQKLADVGNSPAYSRLLADAATPPLPVNPPLVSSFLKMPISSIPARIFNGVPADSIIAPSQRALDFRARISGELAKAGTANSPINVDPATGRYSAAVPLPVTAGTGTSPIVPNTPAYDPNAAQPPVQIPTVTTQAQYDAIPSGVNAKYYDSRGNLRTKK